MSLLFEPGPWDKQSAESAHVFSKKRKLLYGRDHDQADLVEEGPDGYGERERHKMHDIWRRGALRNLSERARVKGDVKIFKDKPGKGNVTGWPGELGKHHAVVEELIGLGVLSIHADDNARTFGLVHRDKLAQAMEYFGKAATKPTDGSERAQVASAGVGFGLGSPCFMPAEAFFGHRQGYVFKMDQQGLGYYIDGYKPQDATPSTALPDGWVQGRSLEGYIYYHHVPTGTSSWERPTGDGCVVPATTLTTTISISAALLASLTSAGGAGLDKILSDSGAQVMLQGSSATISGTTRAVERAKKLIERKASALAFISKSKATGNGLVAQRAAVDVVEKPDYSFTGRIAPSNPAVEEKNMSALGMLGAYGESDDEHAAAQ